MFILGGILITACIFSAGTAFGAWWASRARP